MYGFGDVKTPLPESVAIIEDVVREFITKMVCHFSWCCHLLVPQRVTYNPANEYLARSYRRVLFVQAREASKLSAKRGKKLVSPACWCGMGTDYCNLSACLLPVLCRRWRTFCCWCASNPRCITERVSST